MNIERDTRPWTEVKALMTRLVTTDAQAIMQAGAEAAGATFDGLVRSDLPPPVRRRGVAAYWTAKQRAWWWGTMRAKALGRSHALPGWKAAYRRIEGRKTLVISGAYRRSNTLVRTLSYTVKATDREATVTYGTNTLYARWVLDRVDQSLYHKGNWKTLQDMAADHEQTVRAAFEKAARAEFERRWSEG